MVSRRPVPASGGTGEGGRGGGGGGGGAMSKHLMTRMLGMFRSRTQVGVDKAGNHYFSRVEEVDGAMKEKRWVEFKGDQDPTTVPVESICWLNGQRKKAPTPEELAELEARRERIKQNVELLKKKEEEERRAGVRAVKTIGKTESPNLRSFTQQFPGTSLDQKKGPEEVSRPNDATDAEDAKTDNERFFQCTIFSPNIISCGLPNQQDRVLLLSRGLGCHQHEG